MNQGSKDYFYKVKSTSCRATRWILSHGWFFSFVLLAIIVVLIFDLVYSNTHFVDAYESLNDQYYHSSPDKNNYIEMASFNNVRLVKIDPNPMLEKLASTNNQKPYAYMVECRLNEDGEVPVGSEVTITYYDGTKVLFNAAPLPPSYNIWDSKTDRKLASKPVLIGKGSIFNANYIFVMDDQNQLWLEQYSDFTNKSPKLLLKTQNHLSNLFRSTDELDIKTKIKEIYVDYQEHQNDSIFLFFKSIDPYQAILYQKEKDQIRTIRLQLIQLRNHSNPVLLWDEVEKVRKPLHLTSYLYNKLKEMISK